MKIRNDNFILGFLGVVLFFLVISVLYIVISSEMIIGKKVESFISLQVFMPFVILTGFFIFLVAAMLLALSIFNSLKKIN